MNSGEDENSPRFIFLRWSASSAELFYIHRIIRSNFVFHFSHWGISLLSNA